MRTTWKLGALIGAASLVGLGGQAVVMPALAGGSAPDYVLVQAVAGPGGARDVRVAVSGTMSQVKAGTLVAGGGAGTSIGGYTGGQVGAADVTSVGATVAANGIVVSVASPVGLVYDFSSWAELTAPQLAPGDRLDLVVFFPNGGIRSAQVNATAAGGSVQAAITEGNGAGTLDVSDPGDGGTSVAANGVAMGATTHQATFTTGIVGTVIAGNCNACAGTWSTPDGRNGSWTVPTNSPFPPYLTYYQFGGPAGAWTWTWTGQQTQLTESSADYGAYVQVGDDWHLFRSAGSS